MPSSSSSSSSYTLPHSHRPSLATVLFFLGGTFSFLLLLSVWKLPSGVSDQGLQPHLQDFHARAQKGGRDGGRAVRAGEESLVGLDEVRQQTQNEERDGRGRDVSGRQIDPFAPTLWDGAVWRDDEEAPIDWSWLDENEDAAAAAAVTAAAAAAVRREGGKEGRMKVFMDFPQSRTSWGVAHHRALESVLTQHPEAEVVVLVPAPGKKREGGRREASKNGRTGVLYVRFPLSINPLIPPPFPPSLPPSLPPSNLQGCTSTTPTPTP